jgi:rhamnosyl/mannosyltransferase
MKILHVYKDYYPIIGGMENHIRMLAELQAEKGHDVAVLVTNPTRKTCFDTQNGVRVIKAGRVTTVSSTPISLSLPRLLSKERPDITHLHCPYPIGELSQLYFGKAKRVVLTYQSDIIRQKGLLRFYKPFLNKVLSKVDRIIVTSENYMRSSIHLQPYINKCVLIPLGIELKVFLRNSRSESNQIRRNYGSPIILFVGRLRYYKGLQYLLEAMQEIPAKLIVIGTGQKEREWKNLSARLNLEGKVFFVGEIRDEFLPHFYHASDVFVLPACERSEAFGLVQVEAMASGLPVISTELGTGTSFVNKHGETGFVLPARDSNALRDAIFTLLNNPSLRQEMGRKGRERAVKEFSLETMVDRVLNLYGTFKTA